MHDPCGLGWGGGEEPSGAYGGVRAEEVEQAQIQVGDNQQQQLFTTRGVMRRADEQCNSVSQSFFYGFINI